MKISEFITLQTSCLLHVSTTCRGHLQVGFFEGYITKSIKTNLQMYNIKL